jgi:alanyl-tRNA synthetase
MVSSITPDLKGRFHVGNVVKEVAAIVGGKGGGRPDFAEAGGPDASKIDEAIAAVPSILEKQAGAAK